MIIEIPMFINTFEVFSKGFEILSQVTDLKAELDTTGRGQVAYSVIGFFHDFDFYYCLQRLSRCITVIEFGAF